MVSEFVISPKFDVGKRVRIRDHENRAYIGKIGVIVRKGANTMRGQIWVISIETEKEPLLCYEQQLELGVGR